jgi:hypothetical protein
VFFSIGNSFLFGVSVSCIRNYVADGCCIRLPPGPQIVATDEKYPVQHYKRGTPKELLNLAKKDALVGWMEGTRQYTCDEFHTILRCNYICAWGECYGPKQRSPIRKE